MKLIKEEKISKQIIDQYVWSFTVPEDGVYVVSVSARCKNWLQNYKRLFSDDDLAIQIQSAMFKLQQIEDNNIIEKNYSINKGARGAEFLDAEALTKQLLPLLFTYLMAVDKNSIINKKNFGNTFDSLLQTKSTAVNTNVDNIFIPFIELD